MSPPPPPEDTGASGVSDLVMLEILTLHTQCKIHTANRPIKLSWKSQHNDPVILVCTYVLLHVAPPRWTVDHAIITRTVYIL